MLIKPYKKILNLIISVLIKFVFFLRNNIRRIRKIEFENFNEKFIFYSKKYNFILFTKDKYISRETYINGPHDFNFFLKSQSILRKKINYLIDVGANIGTFSIPAVKEAGLKKCIAFEPIKKIFDILNINIFLNGLENKFETYNYLISDDTNESLSVTFNKNNYGDNKFRVIKNKRKLKFKIQKLDHFFKKFNHNELLIKIDVQGFEAKVLNGCHKFLSKRVPMIIEFDRKFIQDKNHKLIINNIKKNYQFISILDFKKNEKINISNIENILCKIKTKKQINCLIF